MNTSQKIERVNRLAASERLAGPEKINAAQTITGGGGSWAFCKTVAGTGNTLQCFLGVDKTEENDPLEVTVYFNIYDPETGSKDGACNLNETDFTAYDGLPIRVARRGGEWWYIHPLEVTEERSCGS